jgi:hypothetical protein
MNFFLDSTLFQNGKDVFLNNRLSQEFLNICRQQKFTIYISSVVIDEIRRQFNIFISNQIKNVRTGIGAINTIPNMQSINLHIPQLEEAMELFDSYFQSLQDDGIVKVVPYSNDFLPELIHRSIHRIKPFTESKQEFRDAVIWFSYAQLAEDQQLENCFLISGNTTDYLNKEGQLYEELAEKSQRFILFKDVHALLNTSFMEPFKATNVLVVSLKMKKWDSNTILNFLEDNTSRSYVLKRLTDDLDGPLADELWSSSSHFSKRVISDLGIVNFTNAAVRGVDFINNDFVISGRCEVKIKYLSSRETGFPEMRDSNLEHAELMLFFDAIYNPDSNTFQNLEISSYEEAHDYWMGVDAVGQGRY